MHAPECNAIVGGTRKQKERDRNVDDWPHLAQQWGVTDQVGQRCGCQTADGGEQHQALVNIASVPIPESRRRQCPEGDQITERIDQPAQRVRFDVKIAAQVKAAPRHAIVIAAMYPKTIMTGARNTAAVPS